jgi:hypothetical protein
VLQSVADEPVKTRKQPARRSVMRGDYYRKYKPDGEPLLTANAFSKLAKLVAPRALEVMQRLMSSAESETVQLQAAAHILDRAYGKPVQPTQEMLPDWTESYSEADMALAIEAIERRIARHKAQVVVDVQSSTDVPAISTDVLSINSEPSIGLPRTDIDQNSTGTAQDQTGNSE